MDQCCSSIYIGTSGWHYNHWRGPFYPPTLLREHWLEYYARHFHTVEINNSFYKLPRRETLERWRSRVPEGFLFAVKASRFITHMKKLREPRQTLASLMERVSALGEKLGPILFQLPPHWGIDTERFKSFLQALPTQFAYAFEFRDPSWFHPRVYELLDAHCAAFCIYDLDGRLSPVPATADFVYIRLHGPDGPYSGSYSDETLTGWADAFARWREEQKTVYCYFDNDQAGYAVRDAMRLREMVIECLAPKCVEGTP